MNDRVATQLGIDPRDVTWTDYAEWFAQSPGYAPLVTLSVAALGIIASIHPRMVQSSFGNLPVLTGDSFSWSATGFWLLFVLSALLFWGRRAAENRADRRDREVRRELIKDQEAAAEKLRDDLRTMPPDPFLNHYQDVYVEVHAAYELAAEIAHIERIDYEQRRTSVLGAIQTALASLATLAIRFDEEDEDRYAANMMVYAKSSSISASQIDFVNNRLKHTPRDVGIGQLRGFLDFRVDLSAATHRNVSEGMSVDESHPAVAFGIPERYIREVEETEPEPDRTWRIGPGAPHAFLTGNAAVFKDIDEIEAWMKQKTTLGIESRAATMRYIQSDDEPRIGSFLSLRLPILESNPDSCDHFLDNTLPLGVVNIHRGKPGLMRGRDKSLEYFHTTTLSILFVLAELLRHLAILENQKSGHWSHLTD